MFIAFETIVTNAAYSRYETGGCKHKPNQPHLCGYREGDHRPPAMDRPGVYRPVHPAQRQEGFVGLVSCHIIYCIYLKLERVTAYLTR